MTIKNTFIIKTLIIFCISFTAICAGDYWKHYKDSYLYKGEKSWIVPATSPLLSLIPVAGNVIYSVLPLTQITTTCIGKRDFLPGALLLIPFEAAIVGVNMYALYSFGEEEYLQWALLSSIGNFCFYSIKTLLTIPYTRIAENLEDNVSIKIGLAPKNNGRCIQFGLAYNF